MLLYYWYLMKKFIIYHKIIKSSFDGDPVLIRREWFDGFFKTLNLFADFSHNWIQADIIINFLSVVPKRNVEV